MSAGLSTERAGFDQARFYKLCKHLALNLKGNKAKDFDSLVDLLFSHGFLLSRDLV